MNVERLLAQNVFSFIPPSLLRIVVIELRKRRNIPQTCFCEISAFRGDAEIKLRWKKAIGRFGGLIRASQFVHAPPRFRIDFHWLYNRRTRADYVACRMSRIFSVTFPAVFCTRDSSSMLTRKILKTMHSTQYTREIYDG